MTESSDKIAALERENAALERRVNALDRDNDSLRDRLDNERKQHAREIAEKNDELEALRQSTIAELTSTFPNFRPLVTQLLVAHTAASPLRSPTGNSRNSKDFYYPDDDAASTEAERSKVDEINDDIGALAAKVERKFTDRERGRLDDVYRPQCWNPQCPARGWFQPIDATECHTCGDPFGRYKPLNDLTQAVDKRCFTRGCPGRNKVNQCVHSWQKMDVSLNQESATG